jgi:hypothetical protein
VGGSARSGLALQPRTQGHLQRQQLGSQSLSHTKNNENPILLNPTKAHRFHAGKCRHHACVACLAGGGLCSDGSGQSRVHALGLAEVSVDSLRPLGCNILCQRGRARIWITRQPCTCHMRGEARAGLGAGTGHQLVGAASLGSDGRRASRLLGLSPLGGRLLHGLQHRA